MNELEQVLAEVPGLVNRAAEDIDRGEIGLKEAEEQVVEFVNRIGGLVVEKIVDAVSEPTMENRVWVDEKQALYKETAPMRHISRFGTVISRPRRGYQINGERRRWHPLDEALGIDRCCGYTPLMSYLVTSFGADEPYGRAAKKLSRSLGFTVSETAVQRNTEAIGARMEERPLKRIDPCRQNEGCDLMIVEVDGTTSPQIHQEPEIDGRAALKQPTEYKECNVVVVEKFSRDHEATGTAKYRRADRWIGAMYGPRVQFAERAHEAGIAMGQLQAKRTAFIADGAKHNWEIRMNHFPEAVEILDVYHALEHLGEFCTLFPNEAKGKQHFARWREMMLAGDTLQLIHEMKQYRSTVSDRNRAQGHINYFNNNRERMAYDRYRASGLPIGSGVVEGACKFVVGKRFKGSGMRWMREDNQAVLNARLAEINDELVAEFAPHRRQFSFLEPESA